MCGVSVCFDLGKRKQDCNDNNQGSKECRAKLAAQLDRSVESMRHRGPNAKGIWISSDNSVGLGHVRLSTRDLSSAGNQPLHSGNEEDDIHIVVNGELYYDPSLREALAQDHDFQSTSDSEMAIALYRRYGLSFTDHIRGEFSLAIFDDKTQTLVVARDRFGVKPLHYGVFDGKLLIATQCKGVIQLFNSRDSLRWDVRCLAQGGGHYGPRTLFDGIKKFPPGHILVVHRGQAEQLDFRPYYRTTYPANKGGQDTRPAGELTKELRARLLEAVRLRLELSDVSIGVLLSGGVDSSAVAGMAAHLRKERSPADNDITLPPPTCFTIGFPDDDDKDESAVASRTAKHLGLPIEKIAVTEQILADEFEEACWLGEVLLWDLQHIAKKALSKHISQRGLKVVLNGDGSDELFGGYPFFVADRLLADDECRAMSLQNVSSGQREKLRREQAEGLQWFGAGDTEQRHDNKLVKHLGLSPAFCDLAVPRYDDWLMDEVRNLSDPFQAIYETISDVEKEEMADYHPLHRAMLAWNKTMLPNVVIAAISDGAEMAHGVESRPPFLDHVVAELAHTLPVDMLVHLGSDESVVDKWIFREAVKPYITEEVYARRKQTFAAPFRWGVGGPLHSKLSSLITRDNVERLGFVHWNRCQDIVDRSFGEKDQLLFRKAIWLAQMISMSKQFGVQPWSLDRLAEAQSDAPVNGHTVDQTNGHADRQVGGRSQ